MANAGVGNITLTWDVVTGATSYEIYISSTTNVTFDLLIGTSSTNSFVDIEGDVTDYYVVSAVNAQSGNSPLSDVVSINVNGPTNFIGARLNDDISLFWDAVTDAISYNIYWSLNTGVTTLDPQINVAGTAHVHSVLSPTDHYYIVTAVTSVGESQPSAEIMVSVPVGLGVPQNLDVMLGASTNTISWSDVTGATSYNIYWSTTVGVTTVDGPPINVVFSSTPYDHTGLIAGTTYYYIVTAVDSSGESLASTQLSATPVAGLAAPINLTSSGSGVSFVLQWDAVAGADLYHIYSSNSSGDTSPSSINYKDSTSITNEFLLNRGDGTDDYFRVATIDINGVEGPLSDAIFVVDD